MQLYRLDDAASLAAQHPRIANALAWLQRHDLNTLAEGRHIIDGDVCFAIVEVGHGHDPATRRFESHRRYTDLQVNVAGGERMEVTTVGGLTVVDDFQPGGDIAFYAEPDRPVTSLAVLPGQVAVFSQGDAHKPSLRLGQAAQAYRKIVIKVDLAGCD